MLTQRIVTVTPKAPLTLDSEGNPGEMEITTLVDPPSGDPEDQVGAVRVATIKGFGREIDGEVAHNWQFRTRMVYTTGDGEATVYLWGYSRWSNQWGAIALINMLPQIEQGKVSSSILFVNGILGLTYIYTQVVDINGDERLFFELTPA